MEDSIEDKMETSMNTLDDPNTVSMTEDYSINTSRSNSNNVASNIHRDALELLNRPEIQKVMDSDVAINALLSRLKQSLLTCEEFIKFIRKKYIFEDEYTQELLKQYKHFFVSTTGVSSLQKIIHDILEFDGKLGEVKKSYVKALQKIYDEMSSLLLTMTKLRKSIKENSRRLEKDVSDAIHNAEKAQNRYISLCQDYEKLKTTDPNKTKLTLRGSKTNKEQEEDILRKVDSAELEYKQKVDHSNSLRDNFLQKERPKIVSELKDLILEMDTAITIQLQKYTIYTENVILNSGVTVLPVDKSNKPMKAISASVENERDLYNFLNKYNSTKNKSNLLVNKNLIPVTYKKHPSMIKHTNIKIKSPPKFAVDPSRNTTLRKASLNSMPSPFDKKLPTTSNITNTTAGFKSSFNGPTSNSPIHNRINKHSQASIAQNILSSPSTNSMMSNNSYNTNATNTNNNNNENNNNSNSSSYNSINNNSNNSNNSSNGNNNGNEDNLNGMVRSETAASFKSLDPKRDLRLPSIPVTITSIDNDDLDRPFSQVQTNTTLPPGIQKDFKTFGVPLKNLIEFEQDMVPAIVRQCIFIIDKYGLNIEGIYRRSANVLDISELKEQIEKDPANISMLLPPKNYSDSDIYLVGSMLKTFFASLPDSLLPKSVTSELKICMSIDDSVTRKNYMHGLVYKLPDAQYWTLRSLLFHLKRVLQHESQNRMNLKAICIIWGPTIIPPNDEDINDVNYQINAMEILIDVAGQAFEPE